MGLFDSFKNPTGKNGPGKNEPGKNPPGANPPGANPPGANPPGKTPPATPGQPAATGNQPAGAPAQPEFLEGTDAFGRRVRFTRDEYKKRILPDLIKAHGGNPEQLAAVIMQGLQQGFAKELVGAANRLVVIDKDPERSLAVLSVVQRDSGDLEAADYSMRELLQKRPQSVGARIGMGMLAERRGDDGKCAQLLWEALQIDPNNADAVHGWLQVRHRQVGDAGYRAEIDKLAALPGTWRAQLWQARLDLQQGNAAAAAATYREQFARAEVEPDAMLMASADLVRAERHDLVKELVAPRFLAGRHHPHVGLALLHHYLATKQHVPGAVLLHQMHLHYGHMIGDQLTPFTAEFDRMRLAGLPQLAVPKEPRVGLFRLEWPAFCFGLTDPKWLLPQKAAGHKQIVLLALAIEGQPQLEPGREEDLGRLTRSVPMFLADHIWLASPHRATVALPMTEPGGWAVMGRPWPEEQIAASLPEGEREHSILVTGVLRIDGDKRRIDLWAYDPVKKERIGHAAAEGDKTAMGSMQLQLLTELWPLIGGPAEHKPPVGDEAFWQRYSDGLGQHAALIVTRSGAMPKDRLYGERYIAQWLQATALQEPRWQPGFWLYASALCLLQELGSPVAKEHARIVAELFRQSPANSPFARLAVRPLRAVGLDTLWQSRRAEIVAAAAGDLNYAQWLERAEAVL